MGSESVKDLDERVMERLKSDESKIVNALEIYYTHFETDKNVTFQGACARTGANPAYVVDYIVFQGNIGMPSNQEEAKKYLNNLRDYRRSL